MEKLILNIDPSNNQRKKTIGIFLKRKLLFDKNSGWLIFSIFLLLASTLTYATITFGAMVAYSAILCLLGPIIVYFVITKPEFGIITYLTLAYTLTLFSRYLIGDFPMGTIMDGMLVLFILGIFIQMKQKKEWQVFNNNISIFILCLLYTSPSPRD